MATKKTGFTIRHYCQGIGDCHLLRFRQKSGKSYWMLIDCGIHTSVKGGSQILDDIVDDIFQQTNGQIDVLVLTHEHTDHISAFRESAGRFERFSVGEVWMAWTEDPSNPEARRLDSFKQSALKALSSVSQRLHGGSTFGATEAAVPLRDGIDELLAFSFGAKGETVRGMRDAALQLAEGRVRYLNPDQSPIAVPSTPAIRAYVLAPSLDAKYLNIVDRVGERYQMNSDLAGLHVAETISNALSASAPDGDQIDLTAPFDASLGTRLSELARLKTPPPLHPVAAFAESHYFGPSERSPLLTSSGRRVRAVDPNETDQSWRRIDYDWLGSAGKLAMQLDTKTNNTSLVLAFEIIETGRVFLFAADAQIGNWLSWQETKWTSADGSSVTGPELLGRTVYYKVGHHGSENATAKAKGLEQMTSEDLAAFIPTNEADAKKVGWGEMPFHSLMTALEAQCGPRAIRADDPRVLGGKKPFKTPSGSIQSLRMGTVGSGGDQRRAWIEFDVA